MESDVYLENSEKAFKNALDKGFLEIKSDSDFGVWKYMYMYTLDGHDYFKNYYTHKYVKVPREK